jgi:hypothetical protein
MVHIILPTDFSIGSLQPVHEVMQYHRHDVVRISLLHLVDIPSGIGDLLFRLRRMDERFPIPQPFNDACEILANRYDSRLTGITPVIRYGSTAGFLENLISGLKADVVYYQDGFREESTFDDSVPLIPLLKRCQGKIVKLDPPATRSSEQFATVGDLLLAGR